MDLLNTVHKRKSAAITTVIVILILLIIFFFGLKYMDPPIETGITVNFGTSQVGSGIVQPKTPIKTKIEPEIVEEEAVEETIEDVVEEVEETTPEDSAPSEEAITQELEESIRLKKIEKEKKEVEETEERERIKEAAEAKAEAERIKAEAEKQAKIKAEAERVQKEKNDKKKKLDALMGGLNKSEGSNTGGEGNDNIGGDKGKETGDPNASGYYGNGGSGGNGDYQLGSRRPLNRPKPNYECEEEGLVVVMIEVNRAGKVIKATPGAKGSTNNAACLLSQAKAAALKTTWEPDSKAGIKQIGIIKYRFSLTN